MGFESLTSGPKNVKDFSNSSGNWRQAILLFKGTWLVNRSRV